MYRFILSFVLNVVLVSFLGASELKISASANLRTALEEIKQEFLKEHPKDQVLISYLSSGAIYAQIKSGLETDIFFSADTQKPDALFREGFGLHPPMIYALGRLVIYATEDFDVSSDQILISPQVKHIAIASPKLAPYGEASVEFLKNIKLYQKIEKKLVMGHSLGQSLSQIKTKAAEVGFTALSLVKFDPMIRYRILDPKLYSPIKQSLIVLKSTLNQALAESFVHFVLSPKGQAIFEKFGYAHQ